MSDQISPKYVQVFLHISKAFDKFSITSYLGQNGVSGSLLKPFNVNNRKQRVVFNAFSAELLNFWIRVPRGSVFGPLIFLIYINDLERKNKSNAADDMLFSIFSNGPLKYADESNLDFLVEVQTLDPKKKATGSEFSCVTPHSYRTIIFP